MKDLLQTILACAAAGQPLPPEVIEAIEAALDKITLFDGVPYHYRYAFSATTGHILYSEHLNVTVGGGYAARRSHNGALYYNVHVRASDLLAYLGGR